MYEVGLTQLGTLSCTFSEVLQLFNEFLEQVFIWPFEFNSKGQIKTCSKNSLKSCKTSENVHDNVPSCVRPTSYIWNFTKFQIELWKLNKPLFGLRLK